MKMNIKTKKYIDRLLELAKSESFTDGSISEPFVEALNGMDDLNREEKIEVKVAVSKGMLEVKSVFGASVLAIWLGGAVENGDSPELYLDAILEKFLAIAKSLDLPISDEEDAFDYDSYIENMDEGLKQGLQFFGQSLVAHIARSPQKRKEIQHNPKIIESIESLIPVSYGALWIDELLKKVSNDLLVIHAEQHVAVRVRYKNLSNCFHLFTLLQEALVEVMPDSQKIENKELLLFAKGLIPDLDEVSDKAWWHYGIASSTEANIVASIWGEMSPMGISTIDDEQIILLWSPIMGSRSWDGSFFTPFLEATPPSVELLEVLNQDETKQYLEKCGLSTKRQENQ